MSREDQDHLTTADLVAGTDARQAERPPTSQADERHIEPQPRPMEAMEPRSEPIANASMREGVMQDSTMQEREPREPSRPGGNNQPVAHDMEQLAALFPPQVAADFRSRWDQLQIGFVDDPRQAVQQADELVAGVMKSLATSFAEQRSRLEAGLGNGEEANTENLRMALRSYRSFFQRLLSL
jgi:hypothetical protein